MSRVAEATYRGCNIFTVAVPTGDGKWSAAADIQRLNVGGNEIFQDATHTALADTEEGARAAARAEAMHMIDDILAEPGR